MNWMRDPFRSFLIVYGALVVLAILLLLVTRQTMNDWYLEEATLPLLEGEAVTIEETWDEDGKSAVERWIKENEDDLFQYRLRPVTDPELIRKLNLEQQELEFNDEESQIDWEARYLAFEEADGEEIDSFSSVELYLNEEGRWYLVSIAINTDAFAVQLNLFNALLFAVAAILFIGLAFAWWVLRRIRRRLTDINLASEQIRNDGDLSTRIQYTNLSGPLAETIDQINQTLSEIEQSVDKTRQQANNIAHDLRTPLTAVYQKVQHAAHNNSELEELEQMLSRLLHTFNLLLRINRLESNGERPPLSEVTLNDVVEDAVDLYQPAFEEKEQQLTVQLPDNCKVSCNHDLLFQVLCNLLDNANKYNPVHGEIAIHADKGEHETTLTVVDQGGGVTESHLQQLCDRFYRVDSSRHHPGNGLGLSFVKAAMHRMNGTLTMSNTSPPNPAGLVVKLTLPNVKA